MRRFGIVTNEIKDPGYRVTERITAYLESKGAFSYVAKAVKEMEAEVDCMLILGGDGTMLQAARENAGKHIPMLGVNLGTLGYLAEVETEQLEAALDKLLQDEYEVEERLMLRGKVESKGQVRIFSPALNDISITRCGSLQIIPLKIYVNGKFLCKWKADGIIVSTPTGSTGYNMSAGGPLVEPGAGLMVLTPICAHTLNARSIIFGADDKVEIEVDYRRDGEPIQVEANADGSEKIAMETGERIAIYKAECTAAILKLSKVSFLEILHKKMGEQ